MNISRRSFVRRTAAGLVGSAALNIGWTAWSAQSSERTHAPLVISTWPFGKPANEKALQILQQGGSNLDAVEKGIWVAETDPAVKSVGLKGGPNAAGVVQLDACIMSGPGHKGGSVAALEGIKHPISAARLVMEKTKHVMLVGEGARLFALEQGLEAVDTNSRELNEKWFQQRKTAQPNASKTKDNHDTIALLLISPDGNLAGGCSTSGLSGKLPGRVGDSPILGSGLYVDNDVGAAGATGIGENVMRYCASFQIVECMRQGMHPLQACREVIRRITRTEGRNDLSINFIALDKQGRFGAAGTDDGFQYAVATTEGSQVLQNPGAAEIKSVK